MTTTTTPLEKWHADSTLGPRMRKSVEKVIGKLESEGKSYHTARTGFFGDPVDPSDLNGYTTEIFLGVGERDVHPDKAAHLERCLAKEREVRETFGYTLTAKNYKRVIAAYEAALIDMRLHRPVIDERRTPEKEAEIDDLMAKHRAEEKAERDETGAVMAEVRALAPAGSQSVIVALLKEDASHLQSDYFANKTVRSVAIGFSHKTREDFRELRRHAETFLPGAVWEERRDNYSMGQGNYLSDHGWDGAGSGWVVRRYELGSNWWSVKEIAEGVARRGDGLMVLDNFWAAIDAQLDQVRKATTVDEVLAACPPISGTSDSGATGFFAGSGGDEQIIDALGKGWKIVRYNAPYYWVARDRNGDFLAYTEGDLYRGDNPSCGAWIGGAL